MMVSGNEHEPTSLLIARVGMIAPSPACRRALENTALALKAAGHKVIAMHVFIYVPTNGLLISF
jgi:hypothetical protein